MPSLALDLPHYNTHVPHVYRTPRHSMNFAEHLHHRAADAYGLLLVLRALADFLPHGVRPVVYFLPHFPQDLLRGHRPKISSSRHRRRRTKQ